MDPTLLTNFGAAGLIACCWLLERRAALTRDKQLAEAHTKLITERLGFDTLISLTQNCTRALTTLESTQRRLISLMDSRRRPAPR
jgi:hypothetical protein